MLGRRGLLGVGGLSLLLCMLHCHKRLLLVGCARGVGNEMVVKSEEDMDADEDGGDKDEV